jgi:hypothetical protein
MSQIPTGVIPRRLLQEITHKASILPLSVDTDPTRTRPPNLPLARTMVAKLLEMVRACIGLVEKDGRFHELLSSLETHLMRFPSDPTPLALRDWLVTIMTIASIGKDLIDEAPSTPLLEEMFSPVSPEEKTTSGDRLSINEMTRNVILDGRSHGIENPSAFRLFVALFKAHCESRTPISVRALTSAAAFPGNDTRPNRLFDKHLSPTIRAIIKSKRGHGGGYFLSLP